MSRRFIAERTACTGPCGSEEVIPQRLILDLAAFPIKRRNK
jgi:hypothetical protein